MAIKGIVPGLLEIGKIKIGIKGKMVTSARGVDFRPPEKLDHFVITTNQRDAEDDFIPDAALMEHLKGHADAVKDANGNLVGIPIRLLWNDPDMNFPTRYASFYGARCVCSGDGAKARTRDGQDRQCPCHKLGTDYKERDKCRPNGVLACLIDGAESFGGCYKFRTTSLNTIKSILGSLHTIRVATGGRLAFLPLRLIVQPKTTSTPDGNITTVHIVSIVYPGTVQALQQITLREARENAQFLLDMRHVENEALGQIVDVIPENEQADIAGEFYPDAASAGASAPQGTDILQAQVEKVAEQQPVTAPAPGPEPEAPHAQPQPPAPTPEIIPIDNEQKQAISDFRRAAGDKWADKAAWAAFVLEKTGKSSALELTHAEAAAFLRAIGEDIPF